MKRLEGFDLTPESFSEVFIFAMNAHTGRNTRDKVRRFDGKTPFFIHPLGAAIDLLNESLLTWEVRSVAATAALLHDVFEDTSVTEADIWAWCPTFSEHVLNEALKIVRKVTFKDSRESEASFMAQEPQQIDYLEVLVRAADISTNLNTLPQERIARSIPYCKKLLSYLDPNLQVARILKSRINLIS